jgi:type II secretory pathway pseudopilin PulG
MQRAGFKRIPRERSPRSGGAFTLIELLVVVTIIVLLLAMLLPSLNRSIALAERTQCAANERQWGNALGAYGSDNYSMFPDNRWTGAGTGIDGFHISWNSKVVQQWWADYLIKNNADSKNDKHDVLNCPTQIWHQWNDYYVDAYGVKQPGNGGLVGYFWMPGRSPDNQTDYNGDGGFSDSDTDRDSLFGFAGNRYVFKAKIGTQFSNCPVMADMKQFHGGLNSWFNTDGMPWSSHIRITGEPEGGNFLFEDGRVIWVNSDITGDPRPDDPNDTIKIGGAIGGLGGWRVFYQLPGMF